ncbi:cupredoxin domain-containing protein [Paenibacillus hexagrammi]|uniref:Cupredoxin domain-containing protein n=1 Tax=Paenibacillus hexagrammi TaxID=2908839 RepID=A0ABY3SK82_9BACL|nr:cupredoxin domain-containing protein [Paenibacillus sp. YPD9-1]UJF34462.1 cupredoxin domain-containing protein [Paenibacillus sp. YPD9-1]
MKKLLALLMGVSLILAMTACGSKTDKSADAANEAPPANAQQVTLKATNFQYDQAEYHVKKGEPVTITLDNEQGVHGAAIKDFNVNLDNSKKTMTFTPDKAGSFPIVCSVMCGSGHANMKATLVVE